MGFPLKTIIAWHTVVIPDGWALCNGQTVNGIVTPNIVGRFPRGAASDGELKATGGAETHDHDYPAVATDTEVDHGHTANPAWSNSGVSGDKAPSSTGYTRATNHNHSASINVGDSGEHAHTLGRTGAGSSLPRHIKTLFIMKVEE